MLPVGQNAIVVIDERLNIAHEVLRKLIRRRGAAGSRKAESSLGGMSGGHDHNHRLGLLRRDEIVEDKSGTAGPSREDHRQKAVPAADRIPPRRQKLTGTTQQQDARLTLTDPRTPPHHGRLQIEVH